MAADSDVLGGREPDEEGTDLLGGHDTSLHEDELGGPEPDEQGTEVLGGPDASAEEDELGGPEAGGTTDVLG